MGRARKGEIEERDGRLFLRIKLPNKRPRIPLPWCSDRASAERRAALVAELVTMLIEHGRPDLAEKTAREAGAAPNDRAAAGFRKAVEGLCAGAFVPKERRVQGLTFEEFGKEWTSGKLTERWPDEVPRKDWGDDKSRLEKYVYPHVGSVPLAAFELEHAFLVMKKLPQELQPATRRHVQQIIGRLLRLAAYPARLIKVSPIPRGFLLSLKKNRKAKSFMYPDEERRLLACAEVPLAYRVLYGVMAREGPRVSDFLGNNRNNKAPCRWRMFDLENGMLLNDWNKTSDPRMWAMDPEVVEALRRWKALRHPEATPDSLVFVEDDDEPINPDRLAERFRRHLAAAGIVRPELFERHEKRVRIRAHDLRATFVTLSLAAGKSERWVMARTGHTSSEMITVYDRMALAAREANMVRLHPMTECIPELVSGAPATVSTSAAAPDRPQTPSVAIETTLASMTRALHAAATAGETSTAAAAADAIRLLLERKSR